MAMARYTSPPNKAWVNVQNARATRWAESRWNRQQEWDRRDERATYISGRIIDVADPLRKLAEEMRKAEEATKEVAKTFNASEPVMRAIADLAAMLTTSATERRPTPCSGCGREATQIFFWPHFEWSAYCSGCAEAEVAPPIYIMVVDEVFYFNVRAFGGVVYPATLLPPSATMRDTDIPCVPEPE